MQLYQLDDKNVTSLNVRKFLLAEYDRVIVREKSYARPKEPAVFSIESDVSEKKISANDFKERRKCFSCRTVVHIKKNCWKLKNANKMPTHEQRKPPNFKKGEHSNPAALYASVYWTQSMDIEFVIDSVATEHFVNNTNLFINFQKLSSSASVAEGTTNILGKGDVNLEIMDNSELMHMDIWGPAPVKSFGGAEYFYSIIDDYSRYAVMYFSKHKNEAFECFKAYKQAMERLTNRKIQRFRSDNGPEFSANYFEQYLIDEGIKIERINTYSPEMNSVAERYNTTIIEGVRGLLHESKLPKNLWAEFVNKKFYVRQFKRIG
ncbi:Retrovirus-related Pol polyprotein from transposon TNT 1-94 [Araneus ventricosus]|uniref:Retrovirus-related Pol polyprotein from transposon TNT 1-94 n=2 Tax=Araneus ventricosus TaxID=182803 RepID=A0A4Y2ILZ0_ARAVE|nr:Retrovirus-related Pol polyprotein from transposon TNT 1-94 [Araneus ventricosus]